ncbi:MAG: 3-deoxy-D-manno-octulosonic acid transferase [Burkholderiaceae bacterium]|nr:3-deoxy-D-manno-octulosonic acid transferase [Burkholderiaceae bacterium]
MLAFYSVLMWCAQPFLRRKLARRGRAEPGYLTHIEERFGRYLPETLPAFESFEQGTLDQRFVWIHAVSLGETRVAGVLLAALRQRLPGMRLLLTHGTATGRAQGQRLLQAGDVQVWQAWDTRAATERFIRQFQPRIGIMMETELWPNMAATCARHGIPLVLANARLSEKTYQSTLRLAWLARPAYQSLAAVWAQTSADARRLEALGAPGVPASGVFGNLKFDARVDAVQLAQGRAWRLQTGRPVVVFASSREGEELQLLQYLQKSSLNTMPAGVNNADEAIENIAKKQFSTSTSAAGVQWLMVPRHPQRFDQVAALIVQQGFGVSRRSQWMARAEAPAAADIWLGDSLGEMALYYGLSDVALLGGSFEPLGGQNLIEAAACGCPVVMGPSTFNFLEAAQLAVQAGAALQVASLPQAVQAAGALLGTAAALDSARTAALTFAAAHQGAADKTAAAVQTLLLPGITSPTRRSRAPDRRP